MRFPSPVRRSVVASFAMLLVAIPLSADAARVLIEPRPIDRPYPTFAGVVIGSFRPTCSQVTIHVARCSDRGLANCYGYLGGGTFDVLCVAESASVANHLTTGFTGYFNGCNADPEEQNSNTSNYDWANRAFPVRWISTARGWRTFGQSRWDNGIHVEEYGDSASVVVTGLTPGVPYTLYGTTSPYDPSGLGNVCTNLTAWVADEPSYVDQAWGIAPDSPVPVSLTSNRLAVGNSSAGSTFVRWFNGDSARFSRIDAGGSAAVFERLTGVAERSLASPADWASVTDVLGNEFRIAGELRPGLGGSVLSIRKIDAVGARHLGWPEEHMPARTLVDAPWDQASPVATATTDGGAIVAWTDTRHGAASRNWRDVLEVTSGDDYQLFRADLQGDGDDEVLSVQLVHDRVVVFDRVGGSLAPIISLPTGHNPYAARTADLNADGDADIVVACANSDSLDVYLSTGVPGAFTRAAITGSGGAVDLELVDLSGDGKPDLIHVRPSSDTIAIRIGLGGGAFGPAMFHAAPDEPQFIASGDLDGDGLKDIAVLGYTNPGAIHAYRNTGGGTFAFAGSRVAGGFAHAIAIGNFVGDSRADVVVSPASNASSFELKAFAGTAGAEILSVVPTPIPISGRPYSLVADDIDRDAHVDLVVCYSDTSYGPSQVFWGTAAGLSSSVTLPAALRSQSMTAADLDGDGVAELIVPDTEPGVPFWGSLHVHQRLRTGRDAYAVRIGPEGIAATGWPVTGSPLATDGADVANLLAVNDGANGAYVAWEQVDPWFGGIRMQHVRADGTPSPAWPDSNAGGAIVDDAPISHRLDDLVLGLPISNGDGGATVAMTTDLGDALFQSVRVVGMSGSGVPSWSKSLGSGSLARLARSSDGSVQVVWRGSTGELRTLRLDPNGAAPAPWPPAGLVLGTSTDSVAAAVVVSDPAHVMVAWVETGGVRVQRLSLESGTPDWASPVTALLGPAAQLALTPGTNGSAILVARTASQIVTQRVDRMGALGDMTPAIDRVADWRADQGGLVRVSWLPSNLERTPGFAADGGLYRLYSIAASGARTLVGSSTAGTGCAYWADVPVPGIASADPTATAARTTFELEAYNPVTRESSFASRDSGFSNDDLPPLAPAAFSTAFTGTGPGTGTTQFDWVPNAVPDLMEHRIFRSPDSLFWTFVATVPMPASHASATTPSGPMYYRIYAADVHGNTSLAATPLVQLGTPGSAGALELSFARPSPSPARTRARLQLTLPVRSSMELAVFDLLGRRVRRLASGERSAGAHELEWDLRDEEGHSVAPGLYLLRLQTPGRELRHRLLVVR